ncbi:MAG: hypothetical protein ABI601_04580 [bacterium]
MSDSMRSNNPELTALTDDYDIVGQLASAQGTHFVLATTKATPGTRRDYYGRVLIEIVRPPEGDEAHALDLLASDTKLLTNLRHRRLVPIIEGRWLGSEAFAVVREHMDDPSVADLLARGERFTNTRTAAILREVHGLLQWAREQNVVHRLVTPERLFLEPTSDRVRITFGAGPVTRFRSNDGATEDVMTVVRLATAMLTSGMPRAELEGRTFAELRPDLPERLHEETTHLLTEAATDHDLTLYLALIGMADPVAEGETERDRIRAEVLEEQRVEREKLANERGELEQWATEERAKLAEEGEDLRGAFALEKAKLEREFAAAQRLLVAERVEMQRIIAAERAELSTKRDALERLVAERLAEIERAAATDRSSIEALRAQIKEAGEIEMERKRAAALEDLDDADMRLTGRYGIPGFVAPDLAPFPEIAFRRDEHLAKVTPVQGPTLPAEPWSVVEVVQKLREPRRTPVEWRKWAVRGGIAAVILLTAGAAVMMESRSPDVVDTRGASVPAAAPSTKAATAPAITAPSLPPATPSAPRSDSVAAAVTGGPTYASASGAVGAPAIVDTAAQRVRRDSVRQAVGRANAARALARSDSLNRASSAAAAARRNSSARRDDRDLMELSDSLAGARSAPAAGGASQPARGTSPR